MNPNSLVRIVMNSFTKPWDPFVLDIVAREVDRVPSLGPRHRERAAVVRRET